MSGSEEKTTDKNMIASDADKTQHSTPKGLSREAIKYLAVFAMLLNHIGEALVPEGTTLFYVLTDIGYFTAITMCYFLVEGFYLTSSRKRYGHRLLLFAIISQIPYSLAFTGGFDPIASGFNMIFTLWLCFLILELLDRSLPENVRIAGIALIFVISFFSDWAGLAPLFVCLFWWAKRGQNEEEVLRRRRLTYLIGILSFCVILGTNTFAEKNLPEALLVASGGALAMTFSGICLLELYSGKRGRRLPFFSKWFFYIFYPAHLLVLGLIRVFS